MTFYPCLESLKKALKVSSMYFFSVVLIGLFPCVHATMVHSLTGSLRLTKD